MSDTILPLQLSGISRRFGRNLVLHSVDLTLDGGEIVGLMGANGSGKTTLFSIIAGLLPADDGKLSAAGKELSPDDTRARAQLAYVAHATQLYPLLTARENLELFADLRDSVGASSRDAAKMLQELGLGDVVDQSVSTFSRGMAQRVVLARALAGDPQLMLLDEPFTALDRSGRALLSKLLLAEKDRGAAILLSSHDVDSLVDVADRVLLLENGVIARTVARSQSADFRGDIAALQRVAVPADAQAPDAVVG